MVTTTKTCESCGLEGESLTLTLTVPFVEASCTSMRTWGTWLNSSSAIPAIYAGLLSEIGTGQVVVQLSTNSVIPVQSIPSVGSSGGAQATNQVIVHTSTETVKPVNATGGQTGIGDKAVVTGEGRRNPRFSGFGAVVAFSGFAILAL